MPINLKIKKIRSELLEGRILTNLDSWLRMRSTIGLQVRCLSFIFLLALPFCTHAEVRCTVVLNGAIDSSAVAYKLTLGSRYRLPTGGLTKDWGDCFAVLEEKFGAERLMVSCLARQNTVSAGMDIDYRRGETGTRKASLSLFDRSRPNTKIGMALMTAVCVR